MGLSYLQAKGVFEFCLLAGESGCLKSSDWVVGKQMIVKPRTPPKGSTVYERKSPLCPTVVRSFFLANPKARKVIHLPDVKLRLIEAKAVLASPQPALKVKKTQQRKTVNNAKSGVFFDNITITNRGSDNELT